MGAAAESSRRGQSRGATGRARRAISALAARADHAFPYRTDTSIPAGALTAKQVIQIAPYPRNLAANAWQRGRAEVNGIEQDNPQRPHGFRWWWGRPFGQLFG